MRDVLALEYAIRRPRASDAEGVHALLAASDSAEFGESTGYELDELSDDWARMELDHDAWMALGPGGEFAGFAFVQQLRYVRIDSEIYVHPGHFGRGIGTTLIRLAEARARTWIPLAPPQARAVLHNWINARNADACSLLEREGYAPERYFWRMRIELGDKPPEPVWPEGVTVCSASPDEDVRPFSETAAEAMADHWGHVTERFKEWRERRTGHGFDPTLWFLAMAGEEPAGVALGSVSEGNGWVDTLAAPGPWRRRGLGAALLHHAFGECRRRGIGRVELAVDAESATGATRLYERVGMRASQ